MKGGRICINIDATMNMERDPDSIEERVHPLHVDFTNQLRDLGYIYRAEITWTKQNAPGKDTAWGSYCLCSNPHIRRNSEYIIIASKDSLLLEGDHMQCDLTKKEFHAWTLSEWKMSPEGAKRHHPVPYPRELVKRCLKLFSYVGNVVLDPFNGSGTTTEMAVRLGRRYIGIDNCEKYCKSAKLAIKSAIQDYDYKFIPSPDTQKSHRKNKQKAIKRLEGQYVFED